MNNKRLLTTLVLLLALACSALAQQGSPVQTLPFTASPPLGVATANCSISGTAGQTTYYYWVVAQYAVGSIAPTAPSCIVTNAPNSLSGSNFVVINWNAASSASSLTYAVLRSTTATFPGTATDAVTASTTSLTQNDQSASLSAYTFTNAPPVSLSLQINNRDYSTPAIVMFDSLGNTQAVFQTSGGFQWYGNQLADATGALSLSTAGNGPIYSVYGSATLAQINAGVTIVPAVTGRTLKIVGVLLQAIGGAAAGCTAIQVDDTTGTPVVGVSVAVAGLTQNTIVTEATATNVTLTTFLTALTANKGLQIIKTGSSCTTLTSLNYRVLYTVNS